MSTSAVTNASLQRTIGRIHVLTKLRQAETTSEMSNLWLSNSVSAFTREFPGEILCRLTGSKCCARPDMSNATRARKWIAEQVGTVKPTLTKKLLDSAHLISSKIVRRSPDEFRSLEKAQEYGIIGLNAGHIAVERAAAVYPKLFPGRKITFLADDLAKNDTNLEPEIRETLDDRFRFIVNHVRNARLLQERFGLTALLVERSVAAGSLSTYPFRAINRYQIRRAWLKFELGATFVLVAGLVAGGFVSHCMGEGTLRTLLWILAFDPGLGFSALSADRYLENRRSELIS